MARREFSKATQRAALARAEHRCEGERAPGIRCDAPVGRGARVEFDHVVPDALGGEPTLENCAALCRMCHALKTVGDKEAIARAKRRADRHDGISDPHRRPLVSRGFTPPPPKPSRCGPTSKTLQRREIGR